MPKATTKEDKKLATKVAAVDKGLMKSMVKLYVDQIGGMLS